jgi:hypothetical protein
VRLLAKMAKHPSNSISGLVVEYIVAIDVTRVRFPADALLAGSRRGSLGMRRREAATLGGDVGEEEQEIKHEYKDGHGEKTVCGGGTYNTGCDAVEAKRQRGDSNPCGQSPMDF